MKSERGVHLLHGNSLFGECLPMSVCGAELSSQPCTCSRGQLLIDFFPIYLLAEVTISGTTKKSSNAAKKAATASDTNAKNAAASPVGAVLNNSRTIHGKQ